MENYSRMVIDLYKGYFTDYKNGKQPDAGILTEVQNKLNLAIDKAKISNEPFDELEALRNDVGYLKYELL